MELENDFTVCQKGEVLGSAQTSLLKAFGVQMSEFRITVKCWWEKSTGKVEAIDEEVTKHDRDDDDDDDDDDVI